MNLKQLTERFIYYINLAVKPRPYFFYFTNSGTEFYESETTTAGSNPESLIHS